MAAIYSIFMVTARVTTPILLAATGGLYSDKAGLPNIALDAMMILGAFMAVYGSFFYGNAGVGVWYAAMAGLAIGLLYGLICVYLKGDNTVVGIAFNLIGWGLTTFLLPVIYGTTGSFVSELIVSLKKITVPLLHTLPIIGGIFKNQTAITYFSWVFVGITYLILYKTKPGMMIRACGENPQAAETVGYHVKRTRLICSGITGVMCAVAGAHLSLGLMTLFSEKMTAGKGFIALAAVTYAKAEPKKVLFISLLFGFSNALSNQLQLLQLPPDLILMVPYIFVVVFVVADPMFVAFQLKKRKMIEIRQSGGGR